MGGGLSQCVVADGKLFVTTVDSHTVHALNADKGQQLWQYTAGGRIDSAPTSYAATVIFGSRDGREGSVTIHQDADLYATLLGEGDTVSWARLGTYFGSGEEG